MSRTVIRYSEAFKLQVVNELESGKFRTHQEARQTYGIRGCSTIPYWLKKYGRDHLLHRILRVETLTEKDQIKALKKEVKQLKEAVSDSRIEELIHKASFEVVCEEYGLGSPEEVKKKLDVQS